MLALVKNIPTNISQNIPKNIQGVFFLTIPLVLSSFAAGIFFRGTDNVIILPHLVAMIGFAFVTLWPNFSKGWVWPRGVFVAALLFYAVYVWLSIFWSSVLYNSTLFAIIFSVLPFMFFTLVLAPEPARWLRVHMVALSLALAVLAVWALVQFLFLDYGARVHHPMLNPNNLAVVFNMGIFPALALYFYARRKPYTIAGFVLAMLCVTAMLTTQSRGGLLSFILASLPFFAFVRGPSGQSLKRALLFWGAVGVAFCLEP